MKTIQLFILFCIISATAYAQAWVWENPINTTSNNIATDPNNNIIVLAANGSATTLLSKYTKDGLLIWSSQLTKATTFTPSGSVVIDKNGNIYTFTEGFDSVNHIFTGVKTRGVTKFDPNGSILWHTNFYTSTSVPQTKLTIQLDDNNNVYVGYFEFRTGSTTINLGNLTATVTPNNFYLAMGSISSNGTPRWVRGFRLLQSASGGLAGATSFSIAGNKLFVSGYMGKYAMFLDNGLNLFGDRCTAWLAAFDCNNGQSLWGKSHSLIYYCAGSVCGCSNPSVNANFTSGKVALTNNLNGAFVFKPLDTIASIMNFGLPTVKSYYTIYDTLGNPVKAKLIEDVASVFNDYENIAGSRGNAFFVQFRDTLRKVDTGFNVKWKATLPPNMGTIYIPQQSNDVLATYTRSGVTYLAKMADSAALISGKTYADWDNDGILSSADSILKNILITSNNSAVSGISGNDSGKYYLYAAPATYNLSAHFNHPYYQFLPVTQTATINQFSDTIRGKDFRLRPQFNFTDVSTTISSLNIARPGRSAAYSIAAKNFGTSAQTIDIGLKLPALTSYSNILGGTVTVNAPDSITISVGAVNPFDTKKANLYLDIATTAIISDTLRFYPNAYPYITDTIKSNNRDTLVQPIRTSFDPNEKEVSRNAQPLADSSKALLYTIHFQNTGNDTAFYVRIADTLSPKLDLSTFNFIDASHQVTTEVHNNIINFIFNPIALVDSNQNEPLSHGFVKFSINPTKPVSLTDTVYNNAAIYFDYNTPVITNVAKSWFYPAAPLPIILQSFVADKKITSVLLRFVTASEADLAHFIIEKSTDGVNFKSLGTVNARGNTSSATFYSFEDMNPVQGINYYRLKTVDKNGTLTYSWILAVRFSDNKPVTIAPNPANDNLYISFRDNTLKALNCSITDASGKIVWAAKINTAVRNTYTVNTAMLPDGIYFITVADNTIIYSDKFAVKH